MASALGSFSFNDHSKVLSACKQQQQIRNVWPQLLSDKETVDFIAQSVSKEIFDEFAVSLRHFNTHGSQILCNETTRYKIADEPDFFYNANLVLNGDAIICFGPNKSYLSPRFAGGPGDYNTVEAYWKMIWHSNTQLIVSVPSNIREKHSGFDCYPYPAGSSVTYHDISVTLVASRAIEHKPSPIVERTLHVSRGSEVREIVQYENETPHSLDYPHYDSNPTELYELVHDSVMQIKQKIEGFLSPFFSRDVSGVVLSYYQPRICVHCTTGQLNSGVFLTIFAASQRVLADAQEDISIYESFKRIDLTELGRAPEDVYSKTFALFRKLKENALFINTAKSLCSLKTGRDALFEHMTEVDFTKMHDIFRKVIEKLASKQQCWQLTQFDAQWKKMIKKT